jgi:hypothetical protein
VLVLVLALGPAPLPASDQFAWSGFTNRLILRRSIVYSCP